MLTLHRGYMLLLALVVAGGGLGLFLAVAQRHARRPNILLIVTDDQRYDSIDYMPRTKARLFEQGVSFSHAYATTPLCCPSRASMLTGMQARNHHVLENLYPLRYETFVHRLHANGYYTGLVGKYLNSWDGTPRPEFDSWVALEPGKDDEPADTYFAPRLNVNGILEQRPGYVTHILRDHAVDFLHEAMGQDEPFFLLFAPNAPHLPADPAPEDRELYSDFPPHRPPSFDEADLSDKPEWLQEASALSAETIAEGDAGRRNQLQSLQAVDKAIDGLLLVLAEQSELDTTLIFFLSDNGFLWGEHRLYGKRMPYEESTRIPFAVRYPPLIAKPHNEDRLVGVIDIAPTIYEVAGIDLPSEVDGRSLVPLLTGTQSWRNELLIEGWRVIEGSNLVFTALRSERYLYIENLHLQRGMEGVRNRAELYDMQRDPFQMENQVDNPAYTQVAAAHRASLAELPATVTIGGPTSGVARRRQHFAAILSPLTLQEPISYTWKATDQQPVTQVGGMINRVEFTWIAPGPKEIAVEASTGKTTVAHSYTIMIAPGAKGSGNDRRER